MAENFLTPKALEISEKLREIPVSEFFSKNAQYLGYDNPTKALFTATKELIDNSLDACEESGILPEIYVEIEQVGNGTYSVVVRDNGPGIMPENVPRIFGKLFYGSKFYSNKQSRGQQGIGVSGAVLYAYLTTGKPALIQTAVGEEYPLFEFEIMIDTKRNEPIVLSLRELDNDIGHGTIVRLELAGSYRRGSTSIDEYLKQTAIINPYARIVYRAPDGSVRVYERTTTEMPRPPREIKPHPLGLDVGTFQRLLVDHGGKYRNILRFLIGELSQVGEDTARKVLALAGVDPKESPRKIANDVGKIKAILEAFRDGSIKLRRPSVACLSPIGENLIKEGLRKELRPEFVTAITRPPSSYKGVPFQVEAGLAYGGDLEKEAGSPVRVYRFANKIPLLYQRGSCLITKVVEDIDWRNYGLQQPGGKGTPVGPAAILVHVASTHIPYTSESKEAIADVEEIAREIRLALQECGRRLRAYLSRKRQEQRKKERAIWVSKIVPLALSKAAEILGEDPPDPEPVMRAILRESYRYAEALDEEMVEEGAEA